MRAAYPSVHPGRALVKSRKNGGKASRIQASDWRGRWPAIYHLAMNTPLSVLILGIEMAASAIVAFAFLVLMGFREGVQPQALTIWGGLFRAFYLLVATTPFLVTSWIVYRRFFSTLDFSRLEGEFPLTVFFLPLVLSVGAALFCFCLLSLVSVGDSAP
jgi:hypothetical protein